MARPGASEETRIRKLHEALRRAVSEGMIGEVLGQKPFAQLLQVQPSTLRVWLEDPDVVASGAFEVGGRGVDYRIDPIATIWVLIRWFERKRDEKIAHKNKIDEATGRQPSNELPDGVTPQDTRILQQIKFANINMQREVGSLIPKAHVEAALIGQTTALVEGLVAAASWLDPTNEWDPALRQSHDAACAATVEKIREYAAKVMAELNDAQSSRSDGGNEGNRRGA